MDSKGYLRIGEAARMAGVSVQTLRRWEDEGRVKAVRTLGGQRVYRASDLAQLVSGPQESLPDVSLPEPTERDSRESEQESAPTSLRKSPKPELSVAPWDARKAHAEADLVVTRLQLERARLMQERRDELARRIRAERQAQDESLRAQLEDAAAARNRASNQKALERVVARIRSGLAFASHRERAAVEGFLAQNGAGDVSLPWLEAEASLLRERIQAEERKAREIREDEDRKRRAEAVAAASSALSKALLCSEGVSLAIELTSNRAEWDAQASQEAVQAVRTHLEQVVTATWTRKQLKSAVREVLAGWE